MKKWLLILIIILLILPIAYSLNNKNILRSYQSNVTRTNLSVGAGTLTFMPIRQSKFDNSLWFNNQTFLYNESGKFGLRQLNKTIEGWFYKNSSGNTPDSGKEFILSMGTGTADRLNLYFDHGGSDAGYTNLTLSYVGILPTAGNGSFVSLKNYTTGKWYYWAIVFYNTSASGSQKRNIRFIVNGSIVANFTNIRGTSSPINKFQIGQQINNPDRRFKGGMDEIRISNKTTVNISRPVIPTAPFSASGGTVALYHFDDVNETGMEECSSTIGSNQRQIFNFTFWDEINQSRFNNISRFESNFQIKNITGITRSFNFSLKKTNPKYVALCAFPRSTKFKMNGTIEYEKTGFAIRNFYYQNLNATEIRKLYTLIDGKKTAITLDVNDELDNPLKNYILNIQRYDIANNSYRTVAMAKTDEKGNDLAYLQQNDAFYRLLVYDPFGTLVFTSQNKKIITASLILNVVPDTIKEIIERFRNINFNLTYRDPPKSFNVTYLTTDTSITQICLNVIWRTAKNDTQLSNQCSSVLAGRLGFKIPNYNGTYIASVYANQNPHYILGSLINHIRTQAATFFQRINYDGIIIAFFIIIVLAGVGAFNPSVGIVLTIIAMIIFINLELTFATYGAILVIIISGIVLLFRMKT